MGQRSLACAGQFVDMQSLGRRASRVLDALFEALLNVS